MFWKKKKENLIQDKFYDLTLNIDRQARVNIIKLACPHYKTNEKVLQTAICLGLTIMEDLATHQASYFKEVNGKKSQLALPKTK